MTATGSYLKWRDTKPEKALKTQSPKGPLKLKLDYGEIAVVLGKIN